MIRQAHHGGPVEVPAGRGYTFQRSNVPTFRPVEEATGILVPQGDAEAMAETTITLLSDARLCKHLGQNAAQDARRRFNLKQQVEAYLSWYNEMLARMESEEKQWARQERNLKSTDLMANP